MLVFSGGKVLYAGLGGGQLLCAGYASGICVCEFVRC